MEYEELVSDSRVSAFKALGSASAPLAADIDLAGIVKNAVAADVPEEPTTATPQNIWRRADAHPIVLLAMLLDRYGKDCLEWSADTLRESMLRDDIAMSNHTWTKVLAVRPLLTTPTPWRRWDVFHWTALGLSGTAPNFDLLEEPRLGHVVAAVHTMKILDPDREFGDEVEKYVAAALRLEGLYYAPPPLQFARRDLESPMIVCTNCHARHRDDDDVRCISCGKETLKKEPFEFAEIRDATKSLWDKIRPMPLDQGVALLGHDSVGNAVYALAINWDYARDQAKAMRAQLRMLRDHA